VLTNPGNLLFDHKGGLWVGTRPPIVNGRVAEGAILRFDVPSDASGQIDLMPAAALTSKTKGDLTQIGSLTFDADGNLWVSSLAGLLRFADPSDASDTVESDPEAVIDKLGY